MNKSPSSWLPHWAPNDEQFWKVEGEARAWKTLWITTFALTLSFMVWFVVSAVVVRLGDAGFSLSGEQLFWLAAMPGLAAGITRLAHMFFVPMFGSRHTVALGTLSLLLPAIGWGFAVQNPETSFSTFMILAFLAGLGGGNFSSFMPSTSLYFPKKEQGKALGIQAGLGNFGVSLTQFLTPVLIGLGAGGAAMGGGLHLATWIYVPFILLAAILAWVNIRSVPITANFKAQFSIFSDKHTWAMTSIYMMTFGAFSGLAAAFPLLIKNLYGGFENAPVPLQYAFLGPLIGSAVRVGFGMIADKTGGAVLTSVSALGMGICAALLAMTGALKPSDLGDFPMFVGLMLGIFFFSGIGNASTFRQMPIIFEPPKSAGVIGWTAAIAAFGPFIVSMLLASVGGTAFFWGLALFCLLNLGLNWFLYHRPGAEKPS